MGNVRARLKKIVREVLYISAIKRSLETIPVLRNMYAPTQRTHPIDRMYGIQTSGAVSPEDIHADPSVHSLISGYAGSQPSIVRRALALLGDVSDFSFVDLGCGKGRITTVATEFPFLAVIGVELSAALAATARANAAIITSRFPDRPKVTITEANVVHFDLPANNVVFFNYHAFGAELVAQIIARFEGALASGALQHMFFVYYNPVHAEIFDASPAFARFYVEDVPYDASEVGFGPDPDDVIAIWQSVQGSTLPSHSNTNRKIILRQTHRAGLLPGSVGV